MAKVFIFHGINIDTILLNGANKEVGPITARYSSVLISEISRRGNGKKEANQGLQVALKSANARLPKTWGLNRK